MPYSRPVPIPDDPPLFPIIETDFLAMTAAELGDHVTGADGWDAILAGAQAAVPAGGIDWTEDDADLADAEVWAAAVAEDVDPGFPDELEAAVNEAERRADLADTDVYNNFVAPPPVAPPPEDPLEGLEGQIRGLQQQLADIVPLITLVPSPLWTLPAGETALTPTVSAAGLMRLSDVGALTWTSGAGLPSPIQIWVQVDSDEPTLIAEGSSGEQQHTWLFVYGHSFRFSLRAGGAEVDSLILPARYAFPPFEAGTVVTVPPVTGAVLPPAPPPDVAAILAQINALLRTAPPAPNAQLTPAQIAAGYITVTTDTTYGQHFVNVGMTAAQYARWVALRQQLYQAEVDAGLPPQGEPPPSGAGGQGGEEPSYTPPAEPGEYTPPAEPGEYVPPE
jgi:hypothetical protein